MCMAILTRTMKDMEIRHFISVNWDRDERSPTGRRSHLRKILHGFTAWRLNENLSHVNSSLACIHQSMSGYYRNPLNGLNRT